jgi:hypothetical protein
MVALVCGFNMKAIIIEDMPQAIAALEADLPLFTPMSP